jgi:hypothetical protein
MATWELGSSIELEHEKHTVSVGNWWAKANNLGKVTNLVGGYAM